MACRPAEAVVNAVLEIVKDRAYWVEKLLTNWCAWMRAPDLPDGAPDRGCGGVVGFAMYGNFDDMCDSMDVRLAETTNSIIDDLPTLEQMAIYRHYDIIAVFAWSRAGVYERTLERAKTLVGDGLAARGVYLGD